MKTTSIRRRFVVVPLAMLVSITSFGCSPGGDEFSSPTSPTPPIANVDRVQPRPAPGTVDHTVNIPGEEFPLHVWVSGLSHAKGSTFQVGQTVSVGYTCGGPAGYTAYIGSMLMSGQYTVGNVMYGNPEVVDEYSYPMGGMTFRVGDKCDSVDSTTIKVDITTPKITHIVFQVWVAKGVGVYPDKSQPPTVFREELNLTPAWQ